jgi:hypothetical protein
MTPFQGAFFFRACPKATVLRCLRAPYAFDFPYSSRRPSPAHLRNAFSVFSSASPRLRVEVPLSGFPAHSITEVLRPLDSALTKRPAVPKNR